jgi:hypothetical protein
MRIAVLAREVPLRCLCTSKLLSWFANAMHSSTFMAVASRMSVLHGGRHILLVLGKWEKASTQPKVLVIIYFLLDWKTLFWLDVLYSILRIYSKASRK